MTRRHWNAASERYSGGDSLAYALEDGWKINQLACIENHLYHGIEVAVYHLDLQRGDEGAQIRVVANPYVNRVVAQITQTA
jgi:hypothetical protein